MNTSSDITAVAEYKVPTKVTLVFWLIKMMSTTVFGKPGPITSIWIWDLVC